MMHLGSDTLVDLAEGQKPESSEPHLQHCDECRRQLSRLREVLTAAAQLSVPEPSPLFWDHFSERVRRAVTAEGAPNREWLGGLWLPARSPVRAAAPWLAVAAITIVAVVAIGISRRPALHETPASAVPTDNAADAVVAPFGAADDTSLNFMGDLVAQMDADAAVEAGLVNHSGGPGGPGSPGSVDEVVVTLTDGERVELQRLLKDELAKS